MVEKSDDLRLAMAAALGEAVPSIEALRVPVLPVHHRSRIAAAACALSGTESVGLALEYAERTSSAWDRVRPRDARPRVAMETARLWLRGRATGAEAGIAAMVAAAAARELDDPRGDVPPPEAVAAMNAAHAASHAALTAQLADGGSVEADAFDEVADCVGWAARFAMRAAADAELEARWQTKRLTEYLIGRA